MLHFIVLCSLLFDSRNRKVVSIAPKSFSQPLEHPNSVIKMLINFFSLVPSGGDNKKVAKPKRSPDIDNLCLKSML